ncbi:MAG: hypothetical protein ACODAQ_08775 [Phycisphaeraceae bacterium]
MWRSTAFTALLAAAVLAGGCTAPYVNIPHQTGDIAANDPNARTVRDVETRALQAVLDSGDVPLPVLIQLPGRSDALTYLAVADALGEQVLIPSDTDEDGAQPASTLTIEQVRIRGWDAEVDVLRPASANVRQRVTVYLKREPFTGWFVRRQHVWRTRVAPDEALAEQQDEDATTE